MMQSFLKQAYIYSGIEKITIDIKAEAGTKDRCQIGTKAGCRLTC